MIRRPRSNLAAAIVASLMLSLAVTNQSVASQSTCVMPTSGTVSGLTLVNSLNGCHNSLISVWSGASAPAGPQAGQLWYNTTSNFIQQFDGTSWNNLWYVDSTNHLSTPPIGGGIVSASITAASTTDLGSLPQSYKTVNGTTTINSFGSSATIGTLHVLRFTGSLTITYNATSMILPGAASIQTQAGDTAWVMYLGSSNWQMIDYSVASRAVQFPAYAFPGNNTGSTANSTYVTIPGLASKASPTGSDIIMIADAAASNSWKRITLSQIAGIVGVTSIGGNVGAFTVSRGVALSGNDIRLSGLNAVLQANHSGNNSTSPSGVMLGMGSTCTITPVYATRVRIQFYATISNTTIGNSISTTLRFGTGVAPTLGTGITGTQIGSLVSASAPGSGFGVPWSNGGIVTGLTPGVAYWFDSSLSAGAGTSAMSGVSCNAEEF